MTACRTGRHPRRSRAAALLLCAAAQACSALPTSTPAERDVFKAEQSAANSIGFHIVDLRPETVAAINLAPVDNLRALDALGRPRRADAIGVGDMLSIAVFEVGTSLFGAASGAESSADAGGAATNPITPGAARHTIPGLQVDAGGSISFPYVGRVRASGRTPSELARVIEGGLKSKSTDPQVVVTVATNLSSTLYVSGDVERPGRVPLTLGHERLLDVIAVAGGPKKPDYDTYVQVTRRNATARILLQTLTQQPQQDITLMPGDRVQLIYKPRSFTAFGATQKVEQVPLNTASVSLAEGIARTGGPLNDRADANAVFLVRYEGPAVARRLGLAVQPAGTPVMYRVDMLNPTNYFLTTKVAMRDQDVLLIASARTDQINKLFGLVSQLVLPLLVGRQVAQ
jgi:polysaccharide export outer membrane protein